MSFLRNGGSYKKIIACVGVGGAIGASFLIYKNYFQTPQSAVQPKSMKSIKSQDSVSETKQDYKNNTGTADEPVESGNTLAEKQFQESSVSSADNTANSLKNDEPDVEKSFDVLVLSDVEADTGSFSLGDEEVTTGVAYDLIPPIDLDKSTAGVGSDDQEFPVLDTDNVFGTLSLDSSSFTKLSMSPVEKPSPCEDGSQSPVVLQDGSKSEEVSVLPVNPSVEPAISSSPEHLTSEDDNDIIVIRESDSTIESNNVAGKNNTEDVLSGSEGEDSIESEESEEQDEDSVVERGGASEEEDMPEADSVPLRRWVELTNPKEDGTLLQPGDVGMEIQTIKQITGQYVQYKHELVSITPNKIAHQLQLRCGQKLWKLNGMPVFGWSHEIVMTYLHIMSSKSFSIAVYEEEENGGDVEYKMLQIIAHLEILDNGSVVAVIDESEDIAGTFPQALELQAEPSPDSKIYHIRHSSDNYIRTSKTGQLEVAPFDAEDANIEDYCFRWKLFRCKDTDENYRTVDVLAVFCSEQEYKGCKSYIAVIDSSTVKSLPLKDSYKATKKGDHLEKGDCRFFKHESPSGSLSYFQALQQPNHYLACEKNKLFLKEASKQQNRGEELQFVLEPKRN